MKMHNQNNITSFKYAVVVFLITVTFTRCQVPSNNKADIAPAVQPLKPLVDKNVSFIDLISNPEKYTGQSIRIIGYINIAFEGNALYFHKEDYDLNNFKNGIWLDISRADMHTKLFQDNNKKYVLIEGTFDMHHNGHQNSFHGSIVKITRLEVRK